MVIPELLRHGAHIKPDYAGGRGEASTIAGRSTDQERPDGKIDGIVKRFPKKERASDVPTTLGMVRRVHANAIEYLGIADDTRGMFLLFGVIGAAFSLWFGLRSWRTLLGEAIADNRFGISTIIFSIFSFIFILCGVYLILKSVRMELFRPSDEPVIFDRQHRKVYRLFRETHPGLKGLRMRWPMRAVEYDWDLIDVEHIATVTTTGSTVTRYHGLVFIVRRSANDPTIIDSFNVGSGFALGELSVAPVWEHIRRFMEEQGPHLPPGESTAPPPHAPTFWSCVGAVSPFSPRYLWWWRERRAFFIVIHLFAPVFLPMLTLWGLFNWLSFKSAIDVDWPPEVVAAVASDKSSGTRAPASAC
jgi:hypothetical protein